MGWKDILSKLMIQVERDTLPDIIQSDFKFFPDLVKKEDLFMIYTKWLIRIDISGFDQKFLEKWCIYDRKLMALPTGLNAETAMINRTLMEKAGIDPNTVWTWELLAEAGKSCINRSLKPIFLSRGQKVSPIMSSSRMSNSSPEMSWCTTTIRSALINLPWRKP